MLTILEYRCTVSELQPLKGFKWAGDWYIVMDSSTDDHGFQYARSWGGLRAGKALPIQKSSVSYSQH